MKKILILFFIIISSSIQAFASTWVEIDDGVFIDKDSIKYYVNEYGRTDYNKKVFWLKFTRQDEAFKEMQKAFKETISCYMEQSVINYSNQTVALKSYALYTDDGSSIMSRHYKDYELEWDAIIPNSDGELWAALVKKPRILNKIYKQQINSSKEK